MPSYPAKTPQLIPKCPYPHSCISKIARKTKKEVYRHDCKRVRADYTIIYSNETENTGLKDNDGYTDTSTKEIFINDMTYTENDDMRKRDMKEYQRKVLRHEIVHAFFAESGLDGCGHFPSRFEHDEELVDWIAIQGVKIYKSWESVGAV